MDNPDEMRNDIDNKDKILNCIFEYDDLFSDVLKHLDYSSIHSLSRCNKDYYNKVKKYSNYTMAEVAMSIPIYGNKYVNYIIDKKYHFEVLKGSAIYNNIEFFKRIFKEYTLPHGDIVTILILSAKNNSKDIIDFIEKVQSYMNAERPLGVSQITRTDAILTLLNYGVKQFIAKNGDPRIEKK